LEHTANLPKTQIPLVGLAGVSAPQHGGYNTVRYGLLANYQTGFGYYSLTDSWYARTNSTGRVSCLWTHPNSIHSSETDQSPRSQWITERNTTSARLIVCLKKVMFAFSTRFSRAFCHFCG